LKGVKEGRKEGGKGYDRRGEIRVYNHDSGERRERKKKRNLRKEVFIGSWG